jgi:hypothetical protein
MEPQEMTMFATVLVVAFALAMAVVGRAVLDPQA